MRIIRELLHQQENQHGFWFLRDDVTFLFKTRSELGAGNSRRANIGDVDDVFTNEQRTRVSLSSG